VIASLRARPTTPGPGPERPRPTGRLGGGPLRSSRSGSEWLSRRRPEITPSAIPQHGHQFGYVLASLTLMPGVFLPGMIISITDLGLAGWQIRRSVASKNRRQRRNNPVLWPTHATASNVQMSDQFRDPATTGYGSGRLSGPQNSTPRWSLGVPALFCVFPTPSGPERAEEAR
jgi:hypothetical protein